MLKLPNGTLSSAQMITTALNVGSNGLINLGNGPTFGILLAILFTHGIICSAGTAILARINIFYVIINRESDVVIDTISITEPSLVGATIAAIVSLLVYSPPNRVSTKDAFTKFENNTGWANSEQMTQR